jgi:hypothetical protein
MMIKKKMKSKKGVSILIGYILLISFAIIISIIFYNWSKTYVPQDSIECPEGVSIFLEQYTLQNNNLTIVLRNNGRFYIDGFYIYGSEDISTQVATIDLSSKIKTGGIYLSNTNSISTGRQENYFETGGFRAFSFDVTGLNLKKIEIIPTRICEIKNRKRYVSCTNSKISEELV